MAKTGPKLVNGKYALTKKGYIRKFCVKHKRHRMEHDMVWEENNGPIPEGYQVHHVDEDKTNNGIGNLELLTALEHKRLHGGCFKNENGEWIKPCKKCGVPKLIEEHYYKHKEGICSWCKSCCVASATSNKIKRRGKKRAQQLMQPTKNVLT